MSKQGASDEQQGRELEGTPKPGDIKIAHLMAQGSASHGYSSLAATWKASTQQRLDQLDLAQAFKQIFMRGDRGVVAAGVIRRDALRHRVEHHVRIGV